jgi:DNA gyrase subunit A
MVGFGIDEVQANFVAEIKLRNINKEYILKRTQEIEDLKKEIEDLKDVVGRTARRKKIIRDELTAVKKKYAVPRLTEIVYDYTEEAEVEEDAVPDYPVHVFLSKEGYLKKITPQSLRMSSEQKYKEGDEASQYWEANNKDELMVFTNKQQCYKTFLSEFADTKASVLGTYLPTALGMDEGETVLWACMPGDYSGSLIFFFENGKAARVELSKYQTLTRRKKLTGAYSDKSPVKSVLLVRDEIEIAVTSTEGRCLIFHSSALLPKTTRSTQGVAVMTLKPKYQLESAVPFEQTQIQNKTRYRAKNLPIAGALLKPEDRGEEQMTI